MPSPSSPGAVAGKRFSPPYLTTNQTKVSGKTFKYVVLRYDEVSPGEGKRQPRTLLSLGRKEKVDPKRARSLADVMRAFVQKGSTMTLEDLKGHLQGNEPQLRILCSRQFGLRLLVEQAFVELGYKEVLAEIDKETRRTHSIERLVFGMILQHVVWPGSKLRAAERLADVVFYPEGEQIGVDAYYRALDVIGSQEERFAAKLRECLQRVEHLIFDEIQVDTTSSYFETDYDDVEWKRIAEEPDPDRKVPPVVNDPPLRMRGHSKDKQGNKPQIVVEQALAHGYVVHHETHPGNMPDQSLFPSTIAKLDELGLLAEATLTADTGMNTAASRELLAVRQIDWVMGEGRTRTKLVEQLLSTSGRYTASEEDPQLSYRAHRRDDRLFVIRRHEGERKRELRQIDRHLRNVRQVLAQDDRAEQHTKKVCALLSHRTYKKYVRRRVDDPNRLTVNDKAVGKARRRAGMSVISTSLEGLDPSAADGLYRLQFEIENAFRTQKSGIELRPIRHRRADRIKAHVLVQVMAYNVVRHLERKTGMRLAMIRDTMASATVQRVELASAIFWESAELSPTQREIFGKLGYDLPLRRFEAHLEEG